MALIAVAVPAAALVLLPASAVQADIGDLSCAMTLDSTFKPALKAGGKAAISTQGTLTGCASGNGKHSVRTSGKLEASGTATSAPVKEAPCGVLVSANQRGTVYWSDGSTSAFDWGTDGASPNGKVADGQLLRDTLNIVVKDGKANAGCESGLESLTTWGQVSFG
ncbi:hypothetical protein [Nocardia sp. NPDC050175]|uniref:hypothetical protein n=1 Tax=Nocardia sp. NPDC050175 TaxID=3364317 RepID=UPI0037929334